MVNTQFRQDYMVGRYFRLATDNQKHYFNNDLPSLAEHLVWLAR